MPSLWDLLCVSRQKYTTHDDPYSRSHRLWGETGAHNQPAVDYIRPQYTFHREAEPLSCESSFANDDYSPRANHRDELLRPEKRGYRHLFSGLKKTSTNGQSDQRKKPLRNARPLSEASNVFAASAYERSSKTNPEAENRDVVNQGKRRHVQDIFLDNFPHHDVPYHSLNTSSTSMISSHSQQSNQQKRKSRENSRPVHTESMYHYTPRSVNDNDVSAVLFGNRVDDFVHDPDWNRAIDRFAASPSSSSSFSFSDQSLHSPDRFVASPRRLCSHSSSGNVARTPREQTTRSPRDGADTEYGIQSHFILSSNLSASSSNFYTKEGRSRQAGDVGCEQDSFRRDDFLKLREDNSRESQSSPGQGVDIEQLFSANGDVLY